MGGLLGISDNGTTVEPTSFLDSGVPGSIARILTLGCLVSIGTTRDRGAISLTITQDGNYDREYFRNSDECVDWLDRAYAILSGRKEAPTTAPPPAAQRARRTR